MSSKITSTILLFESSVLALINVLAICVILSTKNLRKTFHDVLLLILFSLHFVFGILNLVKSAMVLYKGENKLMAYLRDCVGCAEITFTFILALEQFVAIRQPFFYARLEKKHALLYLFMTCLILIAFWIWLYFFKMIFFHCDGSIGDTGRCFSFHSEYIIIQVGQETM
eukprot:TCONS_00016328-protein